MKLILRTILTIGLITQPVFAQTGNATATATSSAATSSEKECANGNERGFSPDPLPHPFLRSGLFDQGRGQGCMMVSTVNANIIAKVVASGSFDATRIFDDLMECLSISGYPNAWISPVPREALDTCKEEVMTQLLGRPTTEPVQIDRVGGSDVERINNQGQFIQICRRIRDVRRNGGASTIGTNSPSSRHQSAVKSSNAAIPSASNANAVCRMRISDSNEPQNDVTVDIDANGRIVRVTSANPLIPVDHYAGATVVEYTVEE